MRERQENKNALVGFLVCTTGALFVLLFGRWQPRADFDVTGTLWLMQNILPVIVLCVLLAGATGAFVVWLRSKLAKE
ncbi:MAG TPA: hypothetical protein VGJ55_19365 [Pyrinomonadaceae bacterium]|jgi:hypothetical protein